MAVHEQQLQEVQQTFPVSGTQLTPTQIVKAAVTTFGRPTNPVVAAYVYKTTLGGAQKLMEAGESLVPLSTPMYVVTIHFASGLVATDVDDAVTGHSVVGCMGCDIVQPDGSVRVAPGYTPGSGTPTPTRPAVTGS